MKHRLFSLICLLGLASPVNASLSPNFPPKPAYSVALTPENTITLRGEVSEESVSKLEAKVVELNLLRGDKQYPIYLVIDSPGGSIDAGLDFIHFASTYRDIRTVSIFAASMASAIAEALPGPRYITDTGIMMFHRAKGGFEGQFEDGEVESRLNMAKQIVRIMEQTSATRIGINLAEYKSKVENEWWLVGPSAVSYGVADNQAVLSCSDSLIAQTDKMNVQVFIFSMTVEFSGCPLLRSGVVADPKSQALYLKNKEKLDSKFSKPFINR